MMFNPDLTKQAGEMIFSRKTKNRFTLVFHLIAFCLKNNMSQKHLELTLDVKLNFVEHINECPSKN